MTQSKTKKAGKSSATLAGKKSKQQAKKIASNTKNKQNNNGWSAGSKAKHTPQLVQHKPAGQSQPKRKNPESKVQSINATTAVQPNVNNVAAAPHTAASISPTTKNRAAAGQKYVRTFDSVDSIASDDSQSLFSSQNSMIWAATLTLIAAAGAGWKFRVAITERVAGILKRKKQDPFSTNTHSQSPSSQMPSSQTEVSQMASSQMLTSDINAAYLSSLQAPVSQFSQPNKANTATKVRS